MPLSQAERSRRHKQKMKENGTYEAYKSKNAATQKRVREKNKLAENELPIPVRRECIRQRRAKAAERKRRSRAAQKAMEAEAVQQIPLSSEKRNIKVTNHKSKLSSKRTCKQGHAKTYRIQKKEESYIHALQGNIRPPSDGENIGNAPRKPM